MLVCRSGQVSKRRKAFSSDAAAPDRMTPFPNRKYQDSRSHTIVAFLKNVNVSSGSRHGPVEPPGGRSKTLVGHVLDDPNTPAARAIRYADLKVTLHVFGP